MAHVIRIEVDASLRDSSLIHRILNFKEDLDREFCRTEISTISDRGAVDRALEPLTITGPSKRQLALVSGFIEKALKRNNVADNVRVHRVS
jgi:hypothetical protein